MQGFTAQHVLNAQVQIPARTARASAQLPHGRSKLNLLTMYQIHAIRIPHMSIFSLLCKGPGSRVQDQGFRIEGSVRAYRALEQCGRRPSGLELAPALGRALAHVPGLAPVLGLGLAAVGEEPDALELASPG